jgi:uncharacterized membrane protein
MKNIPTWHEEHEIASTIGQRLADKVASGMGSWRFIIYQSIIVVIWMIINVIAYFKH